MYKVVKRYGHEQGLSATFRQHRAKSHCAQFHGYALAFELEFVSNSLNSQNWCLDFGSLKPVKQWLSDSFDHRTLVSQDDPLMDEFLRMQELELINLNVIPEVGCEAFAEYVYHYVDRWLAGKRATDELFSNQPRLTSVLVSEHGANSAIYMPRQL